MIQSCLLSPQSSVETSPLDPSERCARGGRADPMEDARSGRGGPTACWMEGTRRYEVPGATAAFLLSGRATVARSAFPPVCFSPASLSSVSPHQKAQLGFFLGVNTRQTGGRATAVAISSIIVYVITEYIPKRRVS